MKILYQVLALQAMKPLNKILKNSSSCEKYESITT